MKLEPNKVHKNDLQRMLRQAGFIMLYSGYNYNRRVRYNEYRHIGSGARVVLTFPVKVYKNKKYKVNYVTRVNFRIFNKALQFDRFIVRLKEKNHEELALEFLCNMDLFI